MSILDKLRNKKPTEKKIREIDLTDINSPVDKSAKVYEVISEDLFTHFGFENTVIGMALVLNDYANKIDELEPGFKATLIKNLQTFNR